MFTNNFDPVAFELFFISIRWYSLAYIFGVIFGWIYCKKILIKSNTIQKLFDDYISYLIVGIIIGGRLGYVVFYNFPYFLNNPIEIFMIWNGGMSFHGGLIGIILSTYFFAKKNNQNIYIFLDFVSIVAPIGIFLGRISNFINGELVGKVTNSNWGVIFPSYDDKLRHPSQLYEAFLEGVILFILMNLIHFNKNTKVGTCSFMFLILYGCFRIISEFFREPDIQIGYLFGYISMGTILSLFMIIAGGMIFLKIKMRYKPENFDLNSDKVTPVDEFIEKVLYHPKNGYYTKKIPFGKEGDFITAPTISNLFSEIVTIWLISSWEKFGKPQNFNFVELGPGDGSFIKVLIDTIKNFPDFNKSLNIFLYEKSSFLKKVQIKKIKDTRVKWINNFKQIKKGPIIFFGNEFFDAIPIKQFTFFEKDLFEKYYILNKKTGLNEIYRKASLKDTKEIKSFKTLKNLKFIEYPKKGFDELEKIIEKISKLNGGILLIDYGYLNLVNKSTLQAVMKNKKMNINNLFKNLGIADITYLVNFTLLNEYFLKKNLNVKKVVSQKFFLEKMGIIQRAKILKKKMTQKQEEYMSLTLMRLLHKDLMGGLFKVIFAFKSKKNNFLGFK